MDLFDIAVELEKPEPDPFDWGQFTQGRKAINRLGQECTFVGVAPPPPAGWSRPMYLYTCKPHVHNKTTLGKSVLHYLVDERGVWGGGTGNVGGAPDLVQMS